MRPTVVFAGPTLPPEEIARLPGAVLHPPAAHGDILRAVRDVRPEAIVLVDGAFGNVPAVRHKEILWALAGGVAVYGAGSMGALRAAELAGFGMIGHGLVYRYFAQTPLADDDEVAVAMAPPSLGAGALGEALINMRITFARAMQRGVVDRATRAALVADARRMPFEERSYPALLAGRTDLGRLTRWLPGNAVDQKRADACALLDRLARRPPQPPPCAPFVLTEAWAFDLDAAGLLAGDVFSRRGAAQDADAPTTRPINTAQLGFAPGDNGVMKWHYSIKA